MLALIGLFFAALLAATLVPAQSETVLVGLILAGAHPLWGLLVVATAGNVLGALINWGLGRFLGHHAGARWFPVSPKALERARNAYARWGHWSLWGAWLPIVGDPLTFAAGLLREPMWRFLAVVTLAKGGRYLVLAWATVQLS
ncbi:membrane protein YqaA with SNARE-associated domain [Rhodobacter aestuarii]|uniref:Membrane protein YqaA, SNARE-associated domain n=1 Tax=Rhodobacter aestuarii TaxID=453582 RepID=A0A1N7IYP3_9RHOB|nr:YqaA family protein [Rhodobacter aestuarii]PTV97387.1 membrane protein YqaA with SNARE-associated domain [Rhodobacter aestuarii]SIS42127.1 membrane protein YqaA, SNARE-associated domain [Rhodobacter aestuarii]